MHVHSPAIPSRGPKSRFDFLHAHPGPNRNPNLRAFHPIPFQPTRIPRPETPTTRVRNPGTLAARSQAHCHHVDTSRFARDLDLGRVHGESFPIGQSRMLHLARHLHNSAPHRLELMHGSITMLKRAAFRLSTVLPAFHAIVSHRTARSIVIRNVPIWTLSASMCGFCAIWGSFPEMSAKLARQAVCRSFTDGSSAYASTSCARPPWDPTPRR